MNLLSNPDPSVSRNYALLFRNWGAVFVLFLFLSWAAVCQETFEAVPKQDASKYRIDFPHYFFASPEVEKAKRASLYDAIRELESFKGKIARSPDNLQNALRFYNNVQVLFYKHYAYLYLRHAINTRDESSLQESSTLDAEVKSRTAFLRQELIQIDDHVLAQFVAHKPSLKTQLPAIEAVRRYRPYTLSLKEEEALSTAEPLIRDWQSDLYEELRAHAHSIGTKGSNIKNCEEAFKQDYAGTATQRDLYAFSLIRLASSRSRLATLRHFVDAPSEAYFESYWTRAEVDNLLEGIAQHADLYKRYQNLVADHTKKILGYKEVNLWDISASPQGIQPPHYSVDKAAQMIRLALAPLGEEYGRELASLLNPANGRMDIVAGDHRKRGGFSLGFSGTDSVFFSGGFVGGYDDVRVLAHESTHAVHRQLMNSNGVPPTYAEGPHYLFESFAIFSEFLLVDYMYRNETSPALKQYFLEQFFEGKGMEMFRDAPEVAVENAVYDGVRQGSIRSADDLDALTKRIYSRYSIWPERHDELKAEWIYIEFMYDRPFYNVNYVYGVLLALTFYEMYIKDPQHFVPRYIALMRNGFNAPPKILLKQFLGIDLRGPNILSDALRILKDKIDLLEKSYQR